MRQPFALNPGGSRFGALVQEAWMTSGEIVQRNTFIARNWQTLESGEDIREDL